MIGNIIKDLTKFFIKYPNMNNIILGVSDFWLITMLKMYDNKFISCKAEFNKDDCERLLKLPIDSYTSNLIRLSMFSQKLMVMYYRNQLPIVIRKAINRLLYVTFEK